MTQNNLGATLGALAGRVEGPRAAELLNEAALSFRSALQVFTREQLPRYWTRTRNSLGFTLGSFFAVHEFRAGLEQLGRLKEQRDLTDDPQFVCLIYVLEVMCHDASG